MTNKYTASIDGVVIGKRTSKSREYTHCVAVRWSREYDLQAVSTEHRMAQDAKNWQYWMANEDARRYTRDDYIQRAMAAKSGEEYAENEVARQRAAIMADTERYDQWHVITWCGRHVLARKQYDQWSKRADVAQCEILKADKV